MRASDLEHTVPIKGVTECFLLLKLVNFLVFSQNIASVEKRIFILQKEDKSRL